MALLNMGRSGVGMPTQPGGSQPSPLAAAMAAKSNNERIRSMILHGGTLDGKIWQPPAVEMWQSLYPQAPATVGTGTVLTAYLRPVGLVKKIWVQLKATVTAGNASSQTLGPMGIDALVSNVTVYDLSSNLRINTTGWHLRAVANAKRRRTFGAAYTTDMATIMGYGAVNNRVNYGAGTISPNGTSEIDLIMEVPFAYSDRDLRGAMIADTNNASIMVQVTLNPQMFVTSTADPSQALYQSGGSDLATISNVTWQMYQNYLYQLPTLNGVPLYPPQDVATAYVLTQTSMGPPTVSQDFGIPFINARRFQSLTLIYDNAGVLNVNGSDINTIAVQSASFTNILKVDGKTAALMARDHIGSDMPKGTYYLDFRSRPIDTDQYGNMEVVVNPSSVGGVTANFLLGWEAFGQTGQINQGGSLPTG